MTFSIQRLTLIALINGLEDDLRQSIADFVIPTLQESALFNDSEISKIEQRADNESVSLSSLSQEEKLYYTDFGDLIHILNRHRECLSENQQKYLRQKTSELEKIIPVRNRLMHARPLAIEDVPYISSVANSLISKSPFPAENTSSAVKRIENNPSFLANERLRVVDPPNEKTLHNLPLPEFDDTGFVGRDKLLRQIKQSLYEHWPLINITGEGGFGKTALALKAAYDLLEDPECPYEAIVWATAKSQKLTRKEVVNVNNAISHSLGLLGSALSELDKQEYIYDESMNNIIKYMENFKILLILDNIETVLDSTLHEFVAQIPQSSKVLMTSRIGLGAYEKPFQIGELTDNEAITFLRCVARSHNLRQFYATSESSIKKFTRRLQNNPLFIKWFINAVSFGESPERVIRDPKVLLEFCLGNVYEHIDRDAKTVLEAMLSIPDSLDLPMLAHLTEKEPISVQGALVQLMRANFIQRTETDTKTGEDTRYEIRALPKMYLRTYHTPIGKNQSQYIKKIRQVRASGEQLRAEAVDNPYKFSSIFLRRDRDALVAKVLQDALRSIYQQDYEAAKEHINHALELDPTYFEVKRVEAFYYLKMDNYISANEAYEGAVELEPNHAPLRYWFGGFLYRYLDDLHGAIAQFQAGEEIDPTQVHFTLERARIKMYLGEFEQASNILSSVYVEQYSDEKLLKKIHDARLQLHQRRAEMNARNAQDSAATVDLERLRTVYEEIPAHIVDKQHNRTCLRVMHIIGGIIGRANNEEIGVRLSGVEQWLETLTDPAKAGNVVVESDKVIGVVNRVFSDKKYGFADTAEKNGIFFHRNHFVNKDEFGKYLEGRSISFRIGENQRGECAIDVTLAEDRR